MAAFSLARAGVCSGSEAASELAGVLLELLGGEDSDRRWAAEEALVGIGRIDPAVADRLRQLVTAGGPTARKMAIYALRDLGGRTSGLCAELLGALGSPDSESRLAALSALAELFPDEAVVARAVAEIVRSDPSPGVRRAAASALGKLRPPLQERVEVLRLLEAIVEAEDEGLARAARGSLRRLAPKEP